MTANEFIQREREIQEAHAAYPDDELGMAYTKWCRDRGKEATFLNTNDKTLDLVKTKIVNAFRRPCDQPGCKGTQILEGICEGCVEGRAGYRSKWTCDVCMHRELSKKIYLDWYNELKEKGNA